MPYIPHGCDQQQRLQTGVWTPRRVITTRHEVDADGFPLTYATEPAPLDGAHAATGVGAEPERFEPADGLLQRHRRALLSLLAIVVGLPLVWHLIARVTA